MRNGLHKESSIPQFSCFIEHANDRYIAEDERFEYEIGFNKFTGEWSAAVYDKETDECVYETWDANFTPQDAWHEMLVGFVSPHVSFVAESSSEYDSMILSYVYEGDTLSCFTSYIVVVGTTDFEEAKRAVESCMSGSMRFIYVENNNYRLINYREWREKYPWSNYEQITVSGERVAKTASIRSANSRLRKRADYFGWEDLFTGDNESFFKELGDGYDAFIQTDFQGGIPYDYNKHQDNADWIFWVTTPNREWLAEPEYLGSMTFEDACLAADFMLEAYEDAIEEDKMRFAGKRRKTAQFSLSDLIEGHYYESYWGDPLFYKGIKHVSPYYEELDDFLEDDLYEFAEINENGEPMCCYHTVHKGNDWEIKREISLNEAIELYERNRLELEEYDRIHNANMRKRADAFTLDMMEVRSRTYDGDAALYGLTLPNIYLDLDANFEIFSNYWGDGNNWEWAVFWDYGRIYTSDTTFSTPEQALDNFINGDGVYPRYAKGFENVINKIHDYMNGHIASRKRAMRKRACGYWKPMRYSANDGDWYIHFDTKPGSGGELRMSLNNDAIHFYKEFDDVEVPSDLGVRWGDSIAFDPSDFGYEDVSVFEYADGWEILDLIDDIIIERRHSAGYEKSAGSNPEDYITKDDLTDVFDYDDVLYFVGRSPEGREIGVEIDWNANDLEYVCTIDGMPYTSVGVYDFMDEDGKYFDEAVKALSVCVFELEHGVKFPRDYWGRPIIGSIDKGDFRVMRNERNALRKVSNAPSLSWFEGIGYDGLQYYDAESDEVWCILHDLNTTGLYGVVADASTGRHIIEVDDSGTNGSQRAVYEKLVDAYGRIASNRCAAWDWHPNDGYSGCDTHYEGDIAYVICPPDFSDDGWGVQVFDEADEEALDYGETMWEEYGFTSEQQAKEFAELSEFGSRRAWYDDPRRVEYEDDLIAVYGPNGELWYKGIYDYAGVDDGCYRFDEQTGRYICDIDGSWYEKVGRMA